MSALAHKVLRFLPGIAVMAFIGQALLSPQDPQEKLYLPVILLDAPFSAGDLYGIDPIVGNLRYVPHGTFIQGSPNSEACRYSDEALFTHTLTKSLAVMETAVTRQMWADLKAIQSNLPVDPTCTSYGSGISSPVQCVTWYKAVLFANLLSYESHLWRAYYIDSNFNTPVDANNYNKGNTIYCNFTVTGFRLPTEGEREYFTRAGTSTLFSVSEPAFGNGNCYACIPGVLAALDNVAWFCANSGNQTQSVGQKGANPWGLRDVHGNVFDWCWDWSTPYPGGSQTDYRGPSNGTIRAAHGGSSDSYPLTIRSACRISGHPDYIYGTVGFRLVRSLN